MKILRAYKYELDLNNVQRTHCLQHAGAARWAFNWGLRQKQDAYARGDKTPTAIDLHRQLNELKRTDIPWMYEVSKCAPQEALRDLDRAYRNFFAKRARFPRFKSRKRGIGGFRLTGAIHSKGRTVTLPRLGILRVKEEMAVQGRILSATVRERAGRWFVSFQVERSIDVSENQGPSVGVDLGVSSLATLSDGRVIPNPRALGAKLVHLKRLQRRLARAEKGSNRRKRLKARIATLHYRIACVRQDTLHKLTTELARAYGAVGIEDLNVSGMLKNRSLARVISDCGFAEFRRQLEYKCQWYGSRLVVHDRFFPSTKTCSACGQVKEEMSLADRTYHCDGCGLILDRDLNAARNLRPGVPRPLDVDGKALALGQPEVKPARLKRQPNTIRNFLNG